MLMDSGAFIWKSMCGFANRFSIPLILLTNLFDSKIELFKAMHFYPLSSIFPNCSIFLFRVFSLVERKA